MRYALKLKSKFTFICVSKTPEEFKKKINESYTNWRGIQRKGTNATIEDFLTDYDKVEVIVTPYEELK